MEIIKSAQKIPKANMISVTAALVRDSFTWYKIEEDDTHINLYLTDTAYLQFINSDTTYHFNVVDTAHDYTSLEYNVGNGTWHNATIFKVSEQCGAIAFASNSSTPDYSNTICIAFDTTNGNGGTAIISPTTSSYSKIIDGIDDLASTSPTPFALSRGYSAGHVCSQIAPLVNAKTGVKFDNICGILHSNIAMGNLVDSDGSKYLFSVGLAIPCGDEITYTTSA